LKIFFVAKNGVLNLHRCKEENLEELEKEFKELGKLREKLGKLEKEK